MTFRSTFSSMISPTGVTSPRDRIPVQTVGERLSPTANQDGLSLNPLSDLGLLTFCCMWPEEPPKPAEKPLFEKKLPKIDADRKGYFEGHLLGLMAVLFETNRGVALGERHDDRSPKTFLNEKMKSLAARKVKHLYMEGFSIDGKQAEVRAVIDRYFEKGDNEAQLKLTLEPWGNYKFLLDVFLSDPKLKPEDLDALIPKLQARTTSLFGRDTKGLEAIKTYLKTREKSKAYYDYLNQFDFGPQHFELIKAAKKNGVRVYFVDGTDEAKTKGINPASKEGMVFRNNHMVGQMKPLIKTLMDDEKFVWWGGMDHADLNDPSSISNQLGIPTIHVAIDIPSFHRFGKAGLYLGGHRLEKVEGEALPQKASNLADYDVLMPSK